MPWRRASVPAALRGAALLAAAFACGGARAETPSRWELGVGLGALSVPPYRGADGHRAYLLPFPYVTYHGPLLSVDEEGVKGYVLRGEDLRLDLSLAAGVPVSRREDGPRAGMPALAPTVEAGPVLEWRLWREDGERRTGAWLKLPVRAAFAVERSGITQAGWIAAPYLQYVRADGVRRWDVSLGPMFADRRYHDYFYAVPDAYADSTRPAYRSDAGYSGSRVTASLERRWNEHWFIVFARYDALQGAAFAASPLVQKKEYFTAGIAVVKVLRHSRRPEADTGAPGSQR